MLKQRLVATVLIRHGIVVQSIGFRRYLPVGHPSIAVEHLNQWGVDEIILLDMTATTEGRCIDDQLVAATARRCFVPLTVGGGLATVEDITRLVHSGADKISINAAAIRQPDLIRQAALSFGRQCVVVSIDVGRNNENTYEVFLHSGTRPTGLDPFAWARRCADLGAGEILVNSIERDGSKRGFDLDLIRRMTEAVPIPVIAIGGAGHPRHFAEALAIDNLSAAGAGNMFHFIEHSVMLVKAHLIKTGFNVRYNPSISYRDASLDTKGRLDKRPDEFLENLAYEYISEEKI